MKRDVLAGMAAGAAGTTALNAVTYLDMVARARPASSTPEQTVRRAEELTGVRLGADPDGEPAEHRRAGLGALLGIGAGLGTGAIYGLLRPRMRRVPRTLLALGAGLAANVGTTGPMAALGITDPRSWSAGSWVSPWCRTSSTAVSRRPSSSGCGRSQEIGQARWGGEAGVAAARERWDGVKCLRGA